MKKWLYIISMIMIFAAAGTLFYTVENFEIKITRKSDTITVIPDRLPKSSASKDVSAKEKDETPKNVITKTRKLHPIEIEVQECMEKANYTTAGMNNCVYASADKWNAEIEKSLKILKEKLSQDKYEQVEKSQKLWEEYKNSEIDTLRILYQDQSGTIYTNFMSGSQTAIIEKRARDLNETVNTLFNYLL